MYLKSFDILLCPLKYFFNLPTQEECVVEK